MLDDLQVIWSHLAVSTLSDRPENIVCAHVSSPMGGFWLLGWWLFLMRTVPFCLERTPK